MITELLNESDLVLSDDIVEAIIDKVWTCVNYSYILSSFGSDSRSCIFFCIDI